MLGVHIGKNKVVKRAVFLTVLSNARGIRGFHTGVDFFLSKVTINVHI